MRKWSTWLVLAAAGCSGAAPSARPLSAHEPAAPGESQAAPVMASASASAPAPSKAASSAHGRVALLERACELGSSIACNDLGVESWQDQKRARPFLERACELGLGRGCSNLGVFLLSDSADRPRAVRLLDDGCGRSDSRACVRLGDALYDDFPATHDLNKAQASYEKACKLEDPEGCTNVAWMFLRGEGTAKNMKRALESFQFACDKEHFDGCAGLGYAELRSADNVGEAEQGKHWLRVSCDHDVAFGCYMAAQRLAFEEQQLTPRARELFAKACRLGTQEACGASTAPDRPANDDQEPDEEEQSTE